MGYQESLGTILNKLISEPATWCYYYDESQCADIQLHSIRDLTDANKCRLQIIKIIGQGEKSDIYFFHALYKIKDDRLRHIMFTYFLGIAIYRHSSVIRNHILGNMNRMHCQSMDNGDDKFKYIWMLICFFHDLGYAFEDNTIPVWDWCSQVTRLPKRPSSVPKIFSKTLLDKYAKYRRCRFGVYDHGIYGGQVLYKNLCELRQRKEYEQRGSSLRLSWSTDLIKFFALASWVVACHNIWFIGKDDKNIKCYRLCDMNILISDAKMHISHKHYALFFLFCLVDSLEFTKNIQVAKCDWVDIIKVGVTNDHISLDLSGFTDGDKNRIKASIKWLVEIEEDNNVISICL